MRDMDWFGKFVPDYSYRYEMEQLLEREFPYLRFGQVFSDFFEWLKKEGKDPYYIEDNRMYFYFKDYIRFLKGRRE